MVFIIILLQDFVVWVVFLLNKFQLLAIIFEHNYGYGRQRIVDFLLRSLFKGHGLSVLEIISVTQNNYYLFFVCFLSILFAIYFDLS